MGAGAAGLFCAGLVGQMGRKVLIVDHAKKPAEKVRISGGGRCNFTNLHSNPKNFLCSNAAFPISALKRYQPQEFIDLVEAYKIPYHEKTLGQLFCDTSSKDIISMLLNECHKGNVEVRLQTEINSVKKSGIGFDVQLSGRKVNAAAVVVATGGKSIPKMGATGIGYQIARDFDIPLVPTRAGLVPFVFNEKDKAYTQDLSGLSLDAIVTANNTSFQEGFLFTHRGASGPSILQASSYWNEGDEIKLDLLPNINLAEKFQTARSEKGNQTAVNFLSNLIPKRFAAIVCESLQANRKLAEISKKNQNKIIEHIKSWRLMPLSTEGYRTAEVTLGGVDTSALSSQTMEANQVKGLFFIGEVVDVTGHLGGHNFQWAWASAAAAAEAINSQ